MKRIWIGLIAAAMAVAPAFAEDAEKPKKKSRNSNSVALVAGIICIALALVFIGYFLYTFFFADLFSRSKEIEVPELVGLYADEIDKRDYPNFQIQVEEWQPSDTAPMAAWQLR